jgi:methionyl-tRNA formyltransferase
VRALDALVAAGHEIVGVFTQPDRPAGRGQKLASSAVAQRAEALGLPVFKPLKLDADAQAQLRALKPEVMVVVAYGLILPQAALDIPPHGCLNIHASLLPRWRGAAPIQRAILAGDDRSGVTIMKMERGLDTGPMLLSEAVPITADTTSATLHDRLARLGATLIVEALRQLATGTLREQAQPAEGVTYAAKLTKEEARIDWSRAAVDIARAVRGYNPFPITWTELEGQRVRIFAAHPVDAQASAFPGSILVADDHGLRVATGSGLLCVEQLQFAGGRVMTAREAAAGRSFAGLRFS